jgi:DNA polymerase phi
LTAKSGVEGAQALFEEEEDLMEIHEDEAIDANGNNSTAKSIESVDEVDEKDDFSDADGSDVNDEFREKMKAALGKLASNSPTDLGGDEDSDESEFLSDDEMEAFDMKLAEIFKERKRLRFEKRGMYRF